jgi:hypothetical protein
MSKKYRGMCRPPYSEYLPGEFGSAVSGEIIHKVQKLFCFEQALSPFLSSFIAGRLEGCK